MHSFRSWQLANCWVQSITVADYSWQFFERVKQQKYGETEEENSVVAGQNFYGECSGTC